MEVPLCLKLFLCCKARPENKLSVMSQCSRYERGLRSKILLPFFFFVFFVSSLVHANLCISACKFMLAYFSFDLSRNVLNEQYMRSFAAQKNYAN